MPKRVKSLLKTPRRSNHIRQWREKYGLSQDQLVERVRERVETFSKSTLSRIENNRQDYRQTHLEAIAWALGGDKLKPGDLLERDPNHEDTMLWLRDRLSAASDQAIQNFKEMTEVWLKKAG